MTSKPVCQDCRAVGALHCAHPDECGQMRAHIGPLSDARLEQVAFDIFSFRFPQAVYYDNAMHAERSECRRIAVKMAERLTAQWTLETALEQLTAQSINVLFGDNPITPKKRAIIEDFASSYLEDLHPLFGGDERARSESDLYQPEQEPDDSEIEVIDPKERVN